MDDLARLDATAQAELVRAGQLSPLDLVEAAIERVEKLNAELNAVIHPLFDKARAQAASPDLADGPFRGVPMVIKDLGPRTAGDPYHAGMRFLRDLAWHEQEDSYLTQSFRGAGFVVVGKTNAPELGILPTTEPEAHGPTRNPWDTGRSTGGSSGGSAAAVASGMVPIGHANDGGGSIRIPASECGLFGLKPSRGRVSPGPDLDAGSFLSIDHVVTRSVRDSAAVLDLISGYRPGDLYVAPPPSRAFRDEVSVDPGRLRIGVLVSAPGGTADVHPDCLRAVDDARSVLEGLGHIVEDDAPAGLDDPDLVAQFLTLWTVGQAYELEHWSRRANRRVTEQDVEALTWALAEMGRAYTAVDLLRTQEAILRVSERIAKWFEGFDILLTPTLAEPPPPLGEFVSTPDNPLMPIFRAATITPFTPMFNATGQPAMSMPLSWNQDDLPIGVHFVAGYGREDVLIRLAAQLEAACPWVDRRPPVHA
jgi:amidase